MNHLDVREAWEMRAYEMRCDCWAAGYPCGCFNYAVRVVRERIEAVAPWVRWEVGRG